jgi:hypothetical protein
MYADASTDDRVGMEEQYSSATHTSNLKVEERRQMPVDTIIAAGWSRSRVGAALLRLHSEWDSAEKPQRPTDAMIEAVAVRLQEEDSRALSTAVRRGPPPPGLVKPPPTLPRARTEAFRWLFHERGMLFQKLKSLPAVRAELVHWCARVNIHGGADKVADLLNWWLDPTCDACGGTRWQVADGTGRHTGKCCPTCHGTGEVDLPHGQDGRRIERYINDCLEAARASMKGRFRHQSPLTPQRKR